MKTMNIYGKVVCVKEFFVVDKDDNNVPITQGFPCKEDALVAIKKMPEGNYKVVMM